MKIKTIELSDFESGFVTGLIIAGAFIGVVVLSALWRFCH